MVSERIMDFYEVIRKRRSYRAYKHDLPEEEKINRILETARLAPTWANMQGVHYIIVKNAEKVNKIRDAIGQKGKFVDAPIFIIGIISEKDSGERGIKYYPVDFGICFEHLILSATAEGLATCWIGYFNEKKIRKILEIPEKYKILALTPLGYPIKPKSEVNNRKPIEEIVHYDKF
jgi:nitroreductase